MATNITRQPGWNLSVVVTNPATPSSGDPVRYGERTGVALTDEGGGGNGATKTSVLFGPFTGNFSVKGIDDSGNSAVSVGDMIFYVDAETLSKKASGYFFGFALAAVGSGSTATIEVAHPDAGGWVGSVATGDIATGAVTAAKLATTLKTGFVPVPLTAVREATANDIPAAAAHGGVLAKDTTPIFEFTNGDTDSALRLNWAASNSDAIVFQVPLPPDLDVASDVEVHLRAAMASTTDTPVIDIDSYFNEGDTKVSDASSALSDTIAELTIAIDAADVPAGAQTLTVELTPAAHTTDALHLYALWVEYTRA